MRYPLWPKGVTTLESALFVVPAGGAVVLTAVGFEQYKTQESGEAKTEQQACVQRVLHEFTPDALRCCDGPCEWIYVLSRPMAREISSEVVSIGGCGWSLSMCDNLRILGIPGTYRLELNDSAALGVAQVYAELYNIDQIAPQVVGPFFQ